MLESIARLALRAPRLIVVTALLVAAGAAVLGLPVTGSLSAGGFQDPTSESAHAADLLSAKFGRGDVQLLFVVTSQDGARSPAARAVGTEIVEQLKHSPFVGEVISPWTVPPSAAAGLVSKSGKSGLVIAGIKGGGSGGQKHAEALARHLVGDHGGVSVQAGGAMAYVEINHQSKHDLLLFETFAIPLSFLVLVWVFGGLAAAMLPIAVGIAAVIGAVAVLRVIASATQVSTFALNLTVAMGLALAIDYTLLIVSRFRDERAEGAASDDALITAMATAGRTVLFSGMTVGFSIIALLLFPMYFLKSFAFAGIATVTLTVTAALLVTPALIVLLGDRIDALDLRRAARRLLGRAEPAPRPVERYFWYRWTKFAVSHAVLLGVPVLVLLTVLGAPFVGARLGYPDDRVLPLSSPARQVGDELRRDFAADLAAAVIAVIPDAAGLTPGQLDGYATALSRVPDVASVSAPGGTYVDGARVGPPSAPTAMSGGSAFVTVTSAAPLFSAASDAQLDRLHAIPGPAGRRVLLTGTAQINRDSAAAISSRLPAVLAVIAAITFVLLFLLTGSVILPVKALVLNVLSLTATFGALVWVFQDGHLAGLGTTRTGTLVANVPVLLFCIAFGLSMDYEVFLVSRIREHWLALPLARRTSADNDECIALGLARVGRVVTAAALLMSISFAVLSASNVSIMRMFGVGLTLAVLMDATLVRMLLVPAFMHVLGRANWWAPKPLAALGRSVKAPA
ncbi:MMPL family transporter [Mycobacterium sp. SM1]|uniref:MMPL family transporter n=1 Tax=Mycobacterium sp. SM1 TaxID=2816243 RepID=UPI001BCC5C28|nr:MMPL family transporter [Mycobacterium sp. SM1]MBS4727411.1 MMPL family transporter [Mycobacterium sp. SM1]